jgi:ppGpp synthetase/RelA/SpoT-type nucleotidyltranferase
MKKIYSKPSDCINNIDFSNLFESKDDPYFIEPKEIINLYNSQSQIKLVGMELASDHLCKVHHELINYLDINKWLNDKFVPGYKIATIASLFLHVYHTDTGMKLVKQICKKEIHLLMLLYKFYNESILMKYWQSTKKYLKPFLRYRNDIDFIDITDNDLKYGKLIIAKAEEMLNSSILLKNNFFILMFFDLYIAINCLIKNKHQKNEIMPLAFFVLHVMPLVLGIYRYGKLSNNLRDSAFRIIDEHKYLQIAHEIKTALPDRNFISNVLNFLEKIRNKIPAKLHIEKRVKGVYSSYLKSKTYGCAIKNLWDISAIRIVIDSNDDAHCYQMLSLIQTQFERWSDAKGFYDYIANPKKNDYKSLHVVLKSPEGQLVELQIRNTLMHHVAEFGLASHQQYKIEINDANYGPETRNGKRIIEHCLSREGLTLNDLIEHLEVALKKIPIEHYFDGISTGKYDPNALVTQMLRKKER